MKRIFIIHRWSGGPHDDWRPWLQKELEKRGHEVVVPTMPDADVPVIAPWVNHLASVVGIPDKETYFIGHSIGCQAILRYLQTIDTPIGGAAFVAGWSDLEHLEDEETLSIARPWTETPLSLEKIRSLMLKSVLLISDNDPYGFFEKNKQMFQRLGAEIVVLHDAGHITEDDGFRELPQLLQHFLPVLER